MPDAARAFAPSRWFGALLALSCGGGPSDQVFSWVPKNVTVDAGVAAATLAWDEVPGATGYHVYSAADAAVRPDNFATLPQGRVWTLTEPSMAVVGLHPGYAYYFVVTALSRRGDGPPSAAVSAVPRGTIAAPSVTAIAGDGFVELRWVAVARPTSYTVLYASAPGLNFTDLPHLPDGRSLTTDLPHATIDGLVNGRTYWFSVSASYPAEESTLSPEVSALPFRGQPACDSGIAEPRVTTAVLRGSIVNPAATVTSVWFEYGPFGTPDLYGSQSATRQYAVAGPIAIEAEIGPLEPETAYHARIVAHTGSGTFRGAERVFTTLRKAPTVASGLSYPWGLAADADNLYVATMDLAPIAAKVLRVPLAGGPPVELDRTAPLTLAAQGTAGELALAGDTLAWTQCEAGIVEAIPIGGSGPVRLANGLDCPRYVVTSAGSAYWTEHTRIATAPLAGGTPRTIAATSAAPSGLAADGTSVYWLEGDALMSAPAAGGDPVILALGLQSPSPLRLAGGHLYWLEGGSLRAIPTTGGSVTTIAGGFAAADTFEVDPGSATVLGTVPGALDRWVYAVVLVGDGLVAFSIVPLTFQQGVAGSLARGPGAVYWGDGFTPANVYQLPHY